MPDHVGFFNMDKLISACVDAIIAHGLPFIFMALAVWFLWAQDKKRTLSNDQLVSALAKERDERLTYIENRAEACDRKHEQSEARHQLTQLKLERVLIVVAKLPDVDSAALLNAAPVRRSAE